MGYAMNKGKRTHQVYTLLVQVGRKEGDGLPKGATGGALLCYASGVDQAEAVASMVWLVGLLLGLIGLWTLVDPMFNQWRTGIRERRLQQRFAVAPIREVQNPSPVEAEEMP